MDAKTEIAIKILSLPVVAGAGKIVHSKIILPMFRNWKEKKAKAEADAARQLETFERVSQIYKQLHPNGGGSMADKLNALTVDVNNIKESLIKMDAKQKFALNIQNVAYMYADSNGEINYVSPATVKLLNRSESELAGKGWISCVENTDAVRVHSEWRKCIEEKRTFDEYINFKEGKLVHCMAFHSHNRETGKYLGSYATFEIDGTN